VIFTIARVTGYEGQLALALYGLTPWMYLPNYGALGFAFSTRKWILVGLTSVVAIVHIVAIWPDIQPADRLDSDVRSAPRLRVFSANLYFRNDDLSGIIDEVVENDADVAVFQEVTSKHRVRLFDDPDLQHLRHRVSSAETDTMLMSRVPFESSDIWTVPARFLARARLATEIGTVELVAVHTVAPVDGKTTAHWRQMLDSLSDLVATRTTPVLLVGDFNATVYHRRFHDLLHEGLTDAHAARGKGLTGTWPRDRLFPALLRIDHALSTKELTPVTASYGTGRGSDHRPIHVEYALTGG
jgi:endonuclease/exonuclease/phosphatase (EEP) superfamily protein YafD